MPPVPKNQFPAAGGQEAGAHLDVESREAEGWLTAPGVPVVSGVLPREAEGWLITPNVPIAPGVLPREAEGWLLAHGVPVTPGVLPREALRWLAAPDVPITPGVLPREAEGWLLAHDVRVTPGVLPREAWRVPVSFCVPVLVCPPVVIAPATCLSEPLRRPGALASDGVARRSVRRADVSFPLVFIAPATRLSEPLRRLGALASDGAARWFAACWCFVLSRCYRASDTPERAVAPPRRTGERWRGATVCGVLVSCSLSLLSRQRHA